ncbi:hypothetical protein DRN58_01850 [Thermococci archaeon]|nr:MAG: hypothetical protein DRN58_01850 [Thermococci archaeon]
MKNVSGAENMNHKLISIVLILSLFTNISIFIGIHSWDSIYHIGQTKIIYNEGTTSFYSPITLNSGGYNESPLLLYFTACFARVFHLDIDSVIRYIPIFFSFTTLIALYYFFRLFSESHFFIYIGLLTYSLITIPTYYIPSHLLFFTIIAFYISFTAQTKIQYFLIGTCSGLSFLIYAPYGVILPPVIFAILFYRLYKTHMKFLKAITINGVVYLLLISITLIPTYKNNELFVPPSEKITLNIKEEISITTPSLGDSYFREIKLPNIFFFYRGCVGLFLLSLFGISKEKKRICLIVPILVLLIMGNIKYFCDKPFSLLPIFLIPLAIKGIYHFKYKRLLLIMFIFYLLLFSSKRIYLAKKYDANIEDYRKVSEAISNNGIILTDPETRYYLTYYLGTTQCYPLNLPPIKNKGKIKRDILRVLIGEDISLPNKEEIKWIIIPKNPQYTNKLTSNELKNIDLDIDTFKKKINSVDWNQKGFTLIYEDEYVSLYERGDFDIPKN